MNYNLREVFAGDIRMKKFVLLINFLLSTIAYGQDTGIDPDSFVYEANKPLYNLIDTTNWDPNIITWTTTSDDSGTQVNLNFNWTRWGQTFDTAWQSTNGCLSFTGICYSHTSIETGYLENTLYPFWTDLIASGASSKMGYYGDDSKMIFGWYDMREYHRNSKFGNLVGSPGSINSFEVILWANNGYEFRYGNLAIENHNVYIGEEGNSDQEGGKTLNTYLYFNRYAEGVNYGFDQYLANLGIDLEGSSLSIGTNTYQPEEPTDPCENDPQSSPNCSGYVAPTDIIDINLILGYGDPSKEESIYSGDSFDFEEDGVTYENTHGIPDTATDSSDADASDTDLIMKENVDSTDYLALIEKIRTSMLSASASTFIEAEVGTNAAINANIDVLSDVSDEDAEVSTNNALASMLSVEDKNNSTAGSLFNQLLATGATTIGQIVSGAQPDYTKYDVKPLPEQEQNTVAKAEAQLESFTEQDVKSNLDDYTKELQESGGFDSNAQTLTMLLMARVQGYNYGSITLADRATFYSPKSMPTHNNLRDNNNTLRLLLTDDRHRMLVDLQYE